MSLIKLASPVPVLAAGVSVIAGGSIYSNFQTSSPESKSPEKESIESFNEEEETGCVVHVSERVWNNNRSSFTFRVLEKKGRNFFLRGVPASQSKFISDVNDACGGKKSSFKVGEKSQVCVYQEGGQWVYSAHYQSRDWTG